MTASAIDDLILVSVDDHIVEPPDLFERHVPAAYRDRAPRVVQNERGHDVWLYADRQIPNVGLNAVAGRPNHEYGLEPTRFAQLRPGTYDVHQRVQDMNANGVLASLGFPSFPGISGKLFTEAGDRDVSLAMLKAYNDWHILDWAGAYPGRFIPLAILPFWDPQEVAAEVRRTARMGCRVVDFAQNVCAFGMPSIHDRYWDPLWKAMLDEGCVLAVHLGTGSGIGAMSRETPYSAYMSYVAIDMIKFASDVLFSPLLQRYPRLQIALSEGGVGWIPFFLERCEWIFERHSPWTHDDFGGRRPTEVFREHFLTCFIDDRVGIELRDEIGVDHISWECDYPHSDSTWPQSPEYLARSLGEVSREDVDKITHLNALRFFRSDALDRIGRANATVGALRARSTVRDFGAPRVEGLASPLEPGERRQVTYYDLQRIMADTMPGGGRLGSTGSAQP